MLKVVKIHIVKENDEMVIWQQSWGKRSQSKKCTQNEQT